MINQIFQAPDLQQDASKYQISVWWNVLQANKNMNQEERLNLYERALKCLPYCYKIWMNFLKEMESYILDISYLSTKYQQINDIFEKCLLFMHKMPRIWLMYIEFLQKQKLITKTRQVFDRALKSLPVTQHEMIWNKYIEWAFSIKMIDTVKNVINRYIKINPDIRERYAEYLLQNGLLNDAAQVIKQIIDDERFISFQGTSKYIFLMQLCKIISENPKKIQSIDCESVIRHGIKKYTDETGNLWIFLSDFFIKQGMFEKARDVFEEALENVLTARDFGLVYNQYVNFEEEMINLIQYDEQIEEQNDENLELEQSLNKLLGLKQDVIVQEQQEDELEYRLRRLEKLIDRRPILLSNCILRQNKNNIQEWLNRFQIQQNDQQALIRTFGEALTQINPQKAINGLFSQIWIEMAKLYIKNKDFKNANQTLFQASKINFRSIEDSINIWTFWIEYLLENKFYQDAHKVCKQALFKRSQRGEQDFIHNLKIWSFYLDLELNFGTQQGIKQAFQKCIDLKVASPFIFMTYANYLENLRFYEESFKIYEMSIDIFTWPVLYEIWILYLTKFVQRYEGQRLERTRDLFEQVLSTVPEKNCKIFYLLYADFEEKYGLINHVIEIYDRLCQSSINKFENYNIYIAKVSQFLGVTKTRTIFEKAIESLEKSDKIDMGLRFATLERKLGEIDRARSIYQHLSQFSNPDDDWKNLWKVYEDFEVKHGNVDTYKDYMRTKRTIQQTYFMGAPDIERIKQQVIEEEQIEAQ